jgi:5-methylcytosine-specific restriction endonuclease McrA
MKYEKDKLSEIIKKSINWSEVCREYGVPTKGGSPHHIRKIARKYGIDFSHFTGRARNKTEYIHSKVSVQDYILRNNVSSSKLRKKLIDEGLKKEECEICKLYEWMGEFIPLELDHIDGNHHNNNLDNLRILCRNCHGQTHTFGNRSKKEVKFCLDCKSTIKYVSTRCVKCTNGNKRSFPQNSNKICSCGKSKSRRAENCRKCSNLLKVNSDKFKKIKWKPDEEIHRLVNEFGYRKTGKILGVSDNAIRKHLKKMCK